MTETIEDAIEEIALGRGLPLPRRSIHPDSMIFGLPADLRHGSEIIWLTTIYW